jgi:hypothetical protein
MDENDILHINFEDGAVPTRILYNGVEYRRTYRTIGK